VVYLKSMSDFDAMNAVYGAFFAGTPPARTTIQAAALPRDALVEIEATAMARPVASASPGSP
jgi:2-iminobutanoate/2-iminopropanoate deaminase